MRTTVALILVGLFASAFLVRAQVPAGPHPYEPDGIDDATQFIFYSVLEGLYADGVSNQDVDQILMKKEGQTYFHFIYSCPICEPTIWALQAYRSRPEGFFSLKEGRDATFGSGLTASLHQQLYSGDAHQRLTAINTMMKDWMARRMNRMNFSPKERAVLMGELEEKRKQGMRHLEGFRTSRDTKGVLYISEYAPAYLDLTECSVCNGAVGKPMKLPDDGKGK